MTLADLFTTLGTRGALRRSRVPAMKTSLKYFAAALGHASPEQCPVDAACLDPASWTDTLEVYWRTREAQGRPNSASLRRNTRNDIRVIFRQAEAHDLLQAPLPSRLLTKPKRTDFWRQQWATAPYKTTYGNHCGRSYSLPQAQWPHDIQAGWREYQARCGLRIREATLQGYAKLLETYLGYIAHIGGRPPVWEDLFDVTQVAAFVRWHAARMGRSLSAHGRRLVIVIAAIAKVLEQPARQELAALSNGLKAPAPVHIKRNHMVSLATLEAVADTCLAEGRTPLVPHRRRASLHPGVLRAVRFQRGVILKLLVRVPLRQRNVREMQLEKHLYNDPQTDHWHLDFRGDDLKIGHRGTQVNSYQLDLTDFCEEFIPLLKEFLTEHRPKLPGAATSPLVFLTQYGTPYTQGALRKELSDAVAMRTNQRFYPHLIRTIWATECIEKTKDYGIAAEMLGDTLGVVMKTYYHLDKKAQQAKARAFLGTVLRTG
jgi:hypothetical protein